MYSRKQSRPFLFGGTTPDLVILTSFPGHQFLAPSLISSSPFANFILDISVDFLLLSIASCDFVLTCRPWFLLLARRQQTSERSKHWIFRCDTWRRCFVLCFLKHSQSFFHVLFLPR